MIYHVTATRWDDGWELDIDGVGVTQCRSLGTAEHMVRDYLRLEGHEAWESTRVHIAVDLGGLEKEAAESRRKTSEAAHAMKEAAAESRAIARELRERGLSVADTAAVLGVSKGRVSQLVS